MITRRAFLGRATALGATALVGVGSPSAATEPPPETARVRLAWPGGTCQAPKYIAEELLHAEGFTDVQYGLKGTSVPDSARLKALGAGDTDFDLTFAPNLIAGQEAGQSFVILAGGHIGCYELFGTERIRTIRDLRGKTIGARERPGSEYFFVAMMLSYIGLDPNKDVRWLLHPRPEAARLLSEGKIDAFLGLPPRTQELRAKKIGHVVVNSTTDRPWRDYFCCMVAGNRDFVRRHPAATKRVVRALMKANDVCALDPERAARLVVGRGETTNYEYALQTMKEIPYRAWRDYDPADTVRFYALRLHEAGLIKSSPQKILADGTDWRFLNELKKELKG